VVEGGAISAAPTTAASSRWSALALPWFLPNQRTLAMHEPLQLRHGAPPSTITLIRLGARTLTEDSLLDQCERTQGRWGFHGFSVFEVPGGDYALLARLVPIVAARPKLFEAQGKTLIDAGFPLLPTAAHPHWTVVLAAATPRQFQAVRQLFSGPKDNPVFRGEDR